MHININKAHCQTHMLIHTHKYINSYIIINAQKCM